jgi:hypothetical protein
VAPARRAHDPELAEREMRAGIDALDAYGAVGHAARAREELARWLVGQQRAAEAAPLVAAARSVYEEIGAAGWLATLDAWHAGTVALSR